MGQISRILIIVLFFLFLGFSVGAANPLDVVINEIAWMGTATSYNDEWIELKNNSGQEINLENWILKAADGTPEIKLMGNVPINGFYLLERTDDTTVPGITANQIYAGALNNNGEILELYDNFRNLIDRVDASLGWPAGDNTTKQTMERDLAALGAANWQTSQNPGGTPKAENSTTAMSPPTPEPVIELQGETEPVETTQSTEPQPMPEATTTTPTEAQPVIYPSGVVINEILPSPIGADEEEEWVEILNQNNFEVNLFGWQITDTVGGIKVYTFLGKTTVGIKGFLILSRPVTKITLNNSGDGLNLIQPDGKIVDTVGYKKAPQGQSYNRTDSGWFWSAVLTPGSANIIPSPSAKSGGTKSMAENPAPQKELVAIGEQMSANSNVSFLFIVAVFTSVFSGVIILMLKKKSKLS